MSSPGKFKPFDGSQITEYLEACDFTAYAYSLSDEAAKLKLVRAAEDAPRETKHAVLGMAKATDSWDEFKQQLIARFRHRDDSSKARWDQYRDLMSKPLEDGKWPEIMDWIEKRDFIGSTLGMDDEDKRKHLLGVIPPSLQNNICIAQGISRTDLRNSESQMILDSLRSYVENFQEDEAYSIAYRREHGSDE
ncbi:hypothetical protein IMZ48_47185 [Candidatus Bathyarchaeota archaeon]|nr:hypothetical protein [Candidatus Bathyarchaeota archaeon]